MKKILTSVLAAVLTVTAAVPFVSSAEYQKISSDDELMAEMQKNVQEYMENKGRTKLSKEAATACCGNIDACFLALGSNKFSDTMEMYIGDYADNAPFPYYEVQYRTYDRILNITLSDGITYDDIQNYLLENLTNHVRYVDTAKDRWGFTNYLPNTSKKAYYIKMEEDGNMKFVANALKEAGLIDSCYAQFGSVSWNEVTYALTPLRFFQPTASTWAWNIIDDTDEYYTTTEDVLELIASGTIDADFSLVVKKEYVKEGIEYNKFDYPDDYINWSKYACIPVTKDTDFTSLDKDIIDNIFGFTAVPHEESLENQSELLAEIYANVYIEAGRRSSLQKNSECEGLGYVFDALNTVNGDANCDGEYTIADSTAILQSLGNPDKYGLSFQGKYNADIHNVGDGITPSDALEVQKAMASNSKLNS